MSGILLGLFTVVLILVSLFLVLIILMQRASANSGMGSALGGGAAESALGGEAGNVLTKLTVKASVVFFVVAFGLYLGYMARYNKSDRANVAVPTIEPQTEKGAEPVGSGLTAIDAAVEAAAGDAATAAEDAATADAKTDMAEAEAAAEQLQSEVEATVEQVQTEAEAQVEQGLEEADALQDEAASAVPEMVDKQPEDSGETTASEAAKPDAAN